MGDDGGTCSYTLVPGRWETEHEEHCQLVEEDLEFLESEGARGWSCPHDVAGDVDQCVFHRPIKEKDDEQVAEALIRTVVGTSDDAPHRARRHKQLIGARFGDLELPYTVLDADDNYPLDLRHARIEGVVNLQHAIVRHPIQLDGIQVQGAVECQHLRVDGYAHFSDAVLGDELNLLNASFESDADFIQAHIAADLKCQHANFGGDADFSGAAVEGNLMIARATVTGVTSFSKVNIDQQLLLDGGRFADNLWFLDATIGEAAHLLNAEFSADIRFVDATVGGVVSFRGSTIEGDLTFEGMDIDEPWAVNLRETNIDGGTLHQPPEPVVFDLTGATIGDVSLGWADAAATTDTNLFEHLLIRDTTFEEFDFSGYHDSLTVANWEIHTLARDVDPSVWANEPRGPPSASDIETTYLKAKNGAGAVGDQKAAGKFFRWEMIWRRRSHTDLPARSTPYSWLQHVRARKDWLVNLLFGLMAGHGERPRRVVGFSLAIVFTFTGVFAAAWNSQSHPYEHPAGYLILSIESFVTLVLGGAASIRDPWWLRLLAEAEGFTGVFLIALFVFTLTRSVHR